MLSPEVQTKVSKVVSLIEGGMGSGMACKKAKINPSQFYAAKRKMQISNESPIGEGPKPVKKDVTGKAIVTRSTSTSPRPSVSITFEVLEDEDDTAIAIIKGRIVDVNRMARECIENQIV